MGQPFGESDSDPGFVYPPPHPRRPLLLGIAGTIVALGCPPLGIVLGVASITQTRRDGGTFLWGAIAIVASVATAVIAAIVFPAR